MLILTIIDYHVLNICFSALCKIVNLETEHVWPDDLTSQSVRHSYITSLYNGPQGRNIPQKKVRCHQKPASTTVNTIMAYKLSAVFSKQQSANGTAVLRNILLKRTSHIHCVHLNCSAEINLCTRVFLVLLVPVSIMTGTAKAELLTECILKPFQ